MSDINFYYNLKMRARRHPALHRPLKKIRRLAEKFPVLLINLLRAFSSENHPRLGPPKGSFSIYQSLRHENRRPGRVVLTDQGAPTTTPGSLQIVSGLNQHACQPWPVFWSRHQNAVSYTHLDVYKRQCHG